MTASEDDAPDLPSLRQAATRHLTSAGDAAEIYGDLAKFIDVADDLSDEVVLVESLELADQIEPLCDPMCSAPNQGSLAPPDRSPGLRLGVVLRRARKASLAAT
ncbi:hypothetical protein [Pelomonas sp. Root1217]|uniref:hypothetical protein n=1 Tax=Pelomonas sp. Root1217 TaxID=1736430 RepID=UPI000A4BC57B|nr:hypothetical protein [Pelomonas sp. Root1217]